MNTLKHGTRALLASAAAGALVLGSAAGVMAHPSTPKAPKAGYMQVRMVDVHNSPFNVAKPRTIKVKANVWDSVKDAAPTSVKVTLAQFDKKKSKDGKEVADEVAVVADLEVTLTTKASMDRKSKNFRGSVAAETVLAQLTPEEQAALAKTPILMCISKVELVGATAEKKPFKRQVDKKIGNDCFRLVNVAPVK